MTFIYSQPFETTRVKLQTKTRQLKLDLAIDIYFILVLATRDCFQQNLRINYNVAMKTFFSIQLSHVTIVVLSYDVTFWQNHSPYIYSRHFTEPGLSRVETSPNFVLVLSNDHSTSLFNRASLVKVRATPDDFSIYPELIISVCVAPCETCEKSGEIDHN